MNESPAEYGVVGHPVAHSRSPFIHAIFARQAAQNMVYRLHDIAPADLQGFVTDFWQRGGKGLNVTVPHKIAACGLVGTLSERATRAGAVNTLLMDAGGITGDNTDGAGLVRDLKHNLRIAVGSLRVLLLGAGGAARGVLAPLLLLKPRELVIANRSVGRALALASEFAALGPVRAVGFAELEGDSFDLVINATAAGLQSDMPPLPSCVLGAAAICYDLGYAGAGSDTRFTHWAREHGAAQAHMGLGMLVEQAAESFYLWRGVRPDTAAVLSALGA